MGDEKFIHFFSSITTRSWPKLLRGLFWDRISRGLFRGRTLRGYCGSQRCQKQKCLASLARTACCWQSTREGRSTLLSASTSESLIPASVRFTDVRGHARAGANYEKRIWFERRLKLESIPRLLTRKRSPYRQDQSPIPLSGCLLR